MEILELKNTESEISNAMDGLHRRMEKIEQRIRELENRTIWSARYEQERGKRLTEK